MRKTAFVSIISLMMLLNGLFAAQVQAQSTGYYIAFNLSVKLSTATVPAGFSVNGWSVELRNDNKPLPGKAATPSPGSNGELVTLRYVARIEVEAATLVVLDKEGTILGSRQIDLTLDPTTYMFSGTLLTDGQTAKLDAASIKLEAIALPNWATSLVDSLDTNPVTPLNNTKRSGGNPILLGIFALVFLILGGLLLVHGFQTVLPGKKPQSAPELPPVLPLPEVKKEKRRKPTPQELTTIPPTPEFSSVADGGGGDTLPPPDTFLPNPGYFPSADGGDLSAFSEPTPFEHEMATIPGFTNAAPFSAVNEGDEDDLSGDSIGRVGGAVTETGNTLVSTSATQAVQIWLPPAQDGKTTFVGKRKHLDSQFERKSLDFMLAAPASKWLHADQVEIDNQAFLSDLAAGLWTKVTGMGFGPAESAFMQNEARLDFLLEVFKEGQPKKLIAVECDGSQHFTDPVQQQRDVKKNRILDKLGIPLVRVTQVHQLEERLKNLVPVLWEGQSAPLHPHSVLKVPGSVNRKVTRWQRNRKRRRKAA